MCGGLPGVYEFRTSISNYVKNKAIFNRTNNHLQFCEEDKTFRYAWGGVHRSAGHNIYELDRLRTKIRLAEREPERVRVEYLVGVIDEERFKRTTFTNSEKLIKFRRLCDILETYVGVVIERINSIYQDSLNGIPYDEMLRNTRANIEICKKIGYYSEREFLKVGLEYKQATYVFDTTRGDFNYAKVNDSYIRGRLEEIDELCV